MIVQETGDPRLQQGGVVRFAQGRVLEEPALGVSRQIIPFVDKGGTRHSKTLRSTSRKSLASYGKGHATSCAPPSSSQRSRPVVISSHDVGLRPFFLTMLLYSLLLTVQI